MNVFWYSIQLFESLQPKMLSQIYLQDLFTYRTCRMLRINLQCLALHGIIWQLTKTYWSACLHWAQHAANTAPSIWSVKNQQALLLLSHGISTKRLGSSESSNSWPLVLVPVPNHHCSLCSIQKHSGLKNPQQFAQLHKSSVAVQLLKPWSQESLRWIEMN